MGEEGSWDNTIQEWIVDTGYAYAGALAQKEDGAFFAAAPVAEEAGWAFVFKEDHEVDVTQEDGETVKKETINEPTSLKSVVDNCKALPSGLWLGGQKYRVVTGEPKFESGDYTFTQIFAAGTKKGVVTSFFFKRGYGFVSRNAPDGASASDIQLHVSHAKGEKLKRHVTKHGVKFGSKVRYTVDYEENKGKCRPSPQSGSSSATLSLRRAAAAADQAGHGARQATVEGAGVARPGVQVALAAHHHGGARPASAAAVGAGEGQGARPASDWSWGRGLECEEAKELAVEVDTFSALMTLRWLKD